jgi:hypothetical protein
LVVKNRLINEEKKASGGRRMIKATGMKHFPFVKRFTPDVAAAGGPQTILIVK